MPGQLADDVAAECARVAVAAHEALGLRDLSRSDLIVDDDGTVWFLEVNVAPGLHRDLDSSRCRSRPPASTWATSWPSLVRAASAPRLPGPPERPVRDLTYPPIIAAAKLGFRALGQRFQ